MSGLWLIFHRQLSDFLNPGLLQFNPEAGLSLWRNSPTRAKAAPFLRFLDHTHWHTTVARTPLDAGFARSRDLYLTTHNTHNRQASMPLAGFEPAVPASEWPQILALGRSANQKPVVLGIVVKTHRILSCLAMVELKSQTFVLSFRSTSLSLPIPHFTPFHVVTVCSIVVT